MLSKIVTRKQTERACFRCGELRTHNRTVSIYNWYWRNRVQINSAKPCATQSASQPASVCVLNEFYRRVYIVYHGLAGSRYNVAICSRILLWVKRVLLCLYKLCMCYNATSCANVYSVRYCIFRSARTHRILWSACIRCDTFERLLAAIAPLCCLLVLGEPWWRVRSYVARSVSLYEYHAYILRQETNMNGRVTWCTVRRESHADAPIELTDI